MLKSYQALVLLTILISFTQSLSKFYPEIIAFNPKFKNNPQEIQYSAPSLTGDNSTELYIEEEDNKITKEIGLKGILYFVVNFNDSETNIFNATDLEEKSTFETTIEVDTNGSNTYNVTCKLWKPIDKKLNMFCKMDESLTPGTYKFNIRSGFFNYGGKNYTIIQKAENFELMQLNESIPFLYSSKQTLNLDVKTGTFGLKLKIGEYHNETLFMYLRDTKNKFITLDKCSEEGKELNCKIKKEEIETIVMNNGQELNILYFILDGSEKKFINPEYSIHEIYINYSLIKKDIYIQITNLLENEIDDLNYIPYETNVTDIDNVISGEFSIDLITGDTIECFFKKSEKTSLLMICDLIASSHGENDFYLGEIDKQIELKDINIKYNFYILPVINEEKCKIDGDGNIIHFNFPKTLDFTSNDILNIYYVLKSLDDSIGIKLNPDGDELECMYFENIGDSLQKCIVHKSHFQYKQSGYYFTYHKNHLNKSIIYYEVDPIKVILPEVKDVFMSIKREKNEDKIKIGSKGAFALVTDFVTKEQKIFNTSDNINFIGTLIDEDNNQTQYKVNCKLFIPTDEYIRIICNFDGYLNSEAPRMYLDKISFPHNNYSITIEQNESIIFERYYDNIPFLYSDKQIININENEDEYILKFKIEMYNKNPLYIYGSYNNYAILEKCESDTEELTCKIKKEKIEEFLVKKNEQFKIGAINDTIGIIPLEHILNITINYENVQKVDIYLELGKMVGGVSEVGTPVSIETNVTSIPNFISEKFEEKYYFKKISGRPLMLFCDYPEETDVPPSYSRVSEEVFIGYHYKYNFRIQPSESPEDEFSIKGNGTNALLTYPEILNYTSDETLIIRYIMNEPSLANGIKLNPNSTEILNCKDLNKMKLCYVPLSHFEGQKIGANNTYNTLHLNHKENLSIYYESPPIKVIIPYEIIRINIKYNSDHIYVGDKGILYFTTEYNDKQNNIFDESDIEEKTKFNISITSNNKYYNDIKCHFWKNTEGVINIFCKLNENFDLGNQKIIIQNGEFFYNNYKIKISSSESHNVRQFEQPAPFFYAKSQTINVVEETDTYYLKFNIGLYHHEKLVISGENYGFLLLDKCSEEKKELICEINKSDIEEIYMLNLLAYYPYYNGIFLRFPMIDKFEVNYTIPKIDLNITNLKLMDDNVDKNSNFVYEVETDISNASKVMTYLFKLNFTNEDGDIVNGECFFKKDKEEPLYLLCKSNRGASPLSLLEIKNEIVLDNIHVKYNFKIKSLKNDNKVYMEGEGASGMIILQKTLDFYANDEINIDLIFDIPFNGNIKLNLDAKEELVCENVHALISRCKVPKSHFENKQSGNYYIYYLNHKKEYIRFYEFSPFQVILPNENEVLIRIKKENNKNEIKIGKDGIFAIVTDYNDKGKNIFNDTVIGNIEINTNIKDENNNEYKVECHLWEPTDDKMRIICKLENNLKNLKQNIIFEEVSVEISEYKIIFKQIDYIEAIQYDCDIPFLYADKTNININLDVPNYSLKFKGLRFKNDILYIYGDTLNYEILDKCQLNKDDEVTCNISLKKIEGILTLNNGTFKIGAINDNIGIIPLEHILDINIIYPQIEKEEIVIDSFDVINPVTEAGVYFGFSKEFKDLGEINTINVQEGLNCYLRKKGENPLTFLCLINEENEFIFQNTSEDVVYENIHYKYDLRIKPYSNDYTFHIKDFGTDIKLVYPEKLDFTSADSLTIRYIMTNPSLGKNIKLNAGSSDLVCEDLEGMKKCNVTKEHFLGKKSGSYQTLHSNHEGNFVPYYESASINVTLPEEEIVEILVTDEENKEEIVIGEKGIIYFITKYKDEQNIFKGNNIEDNTEFKTTITDQKSNNYDVTCRLWKPSDEFMRIFCDLDKNITYPNIKLNSASFLYGEHKIGIISQMNFGMRIKQLGAKIPFIYEDKQTVEIEKSKDNYELKFKFLEYNNEQLMLINPPKDGEEELNNIFLNCNPKEKELICQITRENIEQILGYSGQEFKLNYIDYNQGLLGVMNNTMNIKINYNSIQKENIYIELKELMENKIGINNYIAYKTNVTTIDTLITNKFVYNNIHCLMKTDEENHLLIICKFVNEGEYEIGDIKEEIKLDNISAKYNLLIQPRTQKETITVQGNSGNILFATPMVLDFNNNEQLTIDYYIYNYYYYNGIRLNPDANKDLTCERKGYGNLVKCTITKNHFGNKKTGYYYTRHKNSWAEYSVAYELSPIKVILPSDDELLIRIKNIDDKDSIKLGQKGVISFITDLEDTQNIFNASDIETSTKHKMTFLGIDNKNYDADCHLWEPTGEKLRLICSFSESIIVQKIKLNKYSFDYNNNKIGILSENDLNINQLSSNIAFLYSDKQTINIVDSKNEYNLVFKKKVYNKEPLILYKDDNNMKNIYLNCVDETTQIKCTITKDQLLRILAKNGDKFYLAQLTNSEGIIAFNNVYDITINYRNVQKKIININIVKLLTLKVDKNNFIVFETSVTDIDIITTDYFSININRNDDMKCLFKKNSNQKDDKLLLLCKADTAGNYKLDISQIDLDEINILYSFKISETKLSETATVSEKEGTKILSVYPQSLNFTSNDNLTIKYQVENPDKLNGVKLNINSTSELVCKNNKGIKECTVPKTHFDQPGSYYTYYTNSLGDTVISYEIPKIEVTLKKGGGGDETPSDTNLMGIIVGCVVGGIVLIVVIILIVIFIKKKKSDSDDIDGKGDKILPNSNQVELVEGDKFE